MKYFSHYLREGQTKALEECKAFFAFSNKQFEEKAQTGVQYSNCGAGLFCPSENVNKLKEMLAETTKQAVKQDIEENGAEKIIRREYFNHETQISGDNSAMICALSNHINQFPELFTDEVIKRVESECFEYACDNDLF